MEKIVSMTIEKKWILLIFSIVIVSMCSIALVSEQLLAYQQPVQQTSPSLTSTSNTPTLMSMSPQIGDTMWFGNHYWLILDVQDDKALLLTENIIERRPFFERTTLNQRRPHNTLTWAQSDIRQWLNYDFYMSFSDEERAMISETRLAHVNNPWWPVTSCVERGTHTIDKIFLLCIFDVLYYFGYYEMPSRLVSTRCECCRRVVTMGFIPVLNDEYNHYRMARWYNGRASQWWLRTTATAGRLVVQGDGTVSSAGLSQLTSTGVRPAMWIYIN